MIIDKYLLNYSFFEKHQITINASKDNVWNTFKSLTLRDLFSIFYLKKTQTNKFLDLIKNRFILLGESDNEILFGLVGKFWINQIRKVSKENFETFNDVGYAKLIWSISIEEKNSNGCILKTETRIACNDLSAYYKFRFYWLFIKPFSGMSRIFLLSKIKKKVRYLYD